MNNAQTYSNPMKLKLSVVVGSQNARMSIRKCLNELESQRNGQEVEIIVVDNSTDGTAEAVGQDFPNIKLIRSLEDKLVPELWEIGINHSAGDIVAITTSHFVPAKNWIEEILKAHETASGAGIGGAIENDETADLVAWAIYFCRYSSYMLPFRKEMVKDFAGDNASYKRSALKRCRHARRDGFWESFVHEEMRKQGFELLVTPTIIVYHQKSFTLSGFINQRFWHGRQFGSERALNVSGMKRATYILLSPLIPIVLLSRITRRVLTKRRHVKEYFLSLPILLLFLLSWSVGELIGYLRTS
ncbi:MAG: glycosyltransferase [Acidobacteria bacterium]|nr:glycosyltransferase [Acidobacteriota bacterium]